MTKQRLLSIAVALLIVLNGITLYLLFQGPHHHGPPPEDRPKLLVIERLGFDAGQVKKYEDLIADHRAAIGALDQEIRKARTALFTDLRAPNYAKRDSLANVIAALQASVERMHHEHFTAVRALCRPDQIPKFDTLMGELSGFFGQHRREGPQP